MPKIAAPLTDIQVKNAKPKEKAYKLADGGGMYLEVTPTGSKLWRMKFRQANGSESRLAFGTYPEVSLAEAREKRLEARKLIAQGIDPGQARRKAKEESASASANTFEKIAREWHANRLSAWSATTAKETINRLEKDIFPEIGKLPIASITHPQMIAALRKIEARGAGEIAHRLKSTCARVFSFANQHGIENKNPAADLKDVLKPVKSSHFAALAPEELPAFVAAIRENNARLYLPTRFAIRLMLLIFVRSSELRTTPWSEINLETGEWIIPWQRMKRGKLTVNPDQTDHHVCLSRQGQELLRELHKYTGGGKYLFPNQRDHEKPMSGDAIRMALNRMGYEGKMTTHGFRALAMTTLKEKLGYRHETVDRQLAHAQKDKIASAYDRAQFLDERKKMMQHWADYLDGMMNNSNVVIFKMA
ncbi:tyrosine-type recombinase/integrase [Undibacterium oligocarboniphilum]|uniref:Integrase arm-type DNA-binding domain-containing protein n=1 Tax=Undibacterium oligocarboniphilum TaxID=666702 RepID=A0A850QGK4_9BURK|nr:integrase arm-type DNA-binding domain-containing protein [Undibacterium oligocarboniphilum]MBC3870298.1 integrase arm-type DNA-binding domain-containing protein [Undibacterium oligocarboniphilum]NVO78289.1 integrase arm-type DNA-binding domain-containing protein [Undibacterium oligocarboniphilum]